MLASHYEAGKVLKFHMPFNVHFTFLPQFGYEVIKLTKDVLTDNSLVLIDHIGPIWIN
jgi:hypothetical protein